MASDRIHLDHDAPTDGVIAGHQQEHEGYRVVRTRGASSWLVVLTIGGEGLFRAEGGEIPARTGELHLLRPNRRHEYLARGDWGIRWAHFRPRVHWTGLLDWPERHDGLAAVRPEDYPGAEDGMTRVEDALRSGGAFAEEMAFAYLEAVLLMGRRAAGATVRMDPRARLMAEWLTRRPERPFDAEALARVADLSPSRAAHLFVQELGTSPRAYLENIRMARAKRLLTLTELPVKAIARELGFESEFYFSARFRKATGRSPTAYRNGI